MHWAGRTQAVSRHGDRQLQHSPASTLAAWWGGGQPSAWPSSLAWAVIWSTWGKAVTRACPARDRFWCSPGVVQGYLLNGCEWGASPDIPGLHFQSSLCPWFALLHSLISLLEQHWVPLCQDQSSCSCTSHVLLSQSFEAEIFFLGRCHKCTGQLPELGLTVLLRVH